jgi:peptidyl-prolyl isomerase G (cyclophilin G)
MCQGGDFTRRNGAGGESIYGANFPDESFIRKHDTHGLLSMANRGPNTQSSQFFITTRPTPHLDGKHVVFGRVVSGFNVAEIMENEPVDANDRPLHNVMIANSGELVLKLPPGVKGKERYVYTTIHSIHFIVSTVKPKSETEDTAESRKRARSVSASESASESESESESDSERKRRKKEKKEKRRRKEKKEKRDKKKNKEDKKKKRSSRDKSVEKERVLSPSPERSPSPPPKRRSPSPQQRRYRDRDAEKPEWEQRRRFDDEPGVSFKGRGFRVSKMGQLKSHLVYLIYCVICRNIAQMEKVE